VKIASKFPNLPFFLHQKPILLPKKKVKRRSHMEVHLEIGEEDPRPGS
jgi:hypothetical protein